MSGFAIRQIVLVVAGPLVAAASTRDRNHDRCVALLTLAASAPPIVAALVVTEVAYFLGDRIGHAAEQAFARSVRDGELHVEPVEPSDWIRISELLGEYSDLPLGIVDASVVASCERLGVSTLATLDRRHFSIVRPRHREALTLLPE